MAIICEDSFSNVSRNGAGGFATNESVFHFVNGLVNPASEGQVRDSRASTQRLSNGRMSLGGSVATVKDAASKIKRKDIRRAKQFAES